MKRQGLRLLAILCILTFDSCQKNEPVPAADFSFSASNEFRAPCHIIFENKSVNSFSWQWKFGDDSTTTAQNPGHWYIKSGNYSVNLRAYTQSGKEWASVTKVIVIRADSAR
jgi:PKD repeat protein